MPAPTSPRSRATSECSDAGSPPWYHSILNDDDFRIVNPMRAAFLEQLRDVADRKAAILSNEMLTGAEKSSRVEKLCIRAPGGAECAVEDLW